MLLRSDEMRTVLISNYQRRSRNNSVVVGYSVASNSSRHAAADKDSYFGNHYNLWLHRRTLAWLGQIARAACGPVLLHDEALLV